MGLGRICMIRLRPLFRGTGLTSIEHAEIEVDSKKLIVLVPIVLSFVCGCYMGGFLELETHAFFVPASVSGAIGILYTGFRQRLKQYLKMLKNSGLADLDIVSEDEDERNTESRTDVDGSSTPRVDI